MPAWTNKCEYRINERGKEGYICERTGEHCDNAKPTESSCTICCPDEPYGEIPQMDGETILKTEGDCTDCEYFLECRSPSEHRKMHSCPTYWDKIVRDALQMVVERERKEQKLIELKAKIEMLEDAIDKAHYLSSDMDSGKDFEQVRREMLWKGAPAGTKMVVRQETGYFMDKKSAIRYIFHVIGLSIKELFKVVRR